MKRILFIVLLTCPLWACTSCEEEIKLPGSKPEILLGKWEYAYHSGFPYPGDYIKTYEFRKKGGLITGLKYVPEEDKYEVYYTINITDWSYEGKTIYFIEKRGNFTSQWELSIEELTEHSARLGGSMYYKK